jgi:hypothetical protein
VIFYLKLADTIPQYKNRNLKPRNRIGWLERRNLKQTDTIARYKSRNWRPRNRIDRLKNMNLERTDTIGRYKNRNLTSSDCIRNLNFSRQHWPATLAGNFGPQAGNLGRNLGPATWAGTLGNLGQQLLSARPMLPAKVAGQSCQPKLPAKVAGQISR